MLDTKLRPTNTMKSKDKSSEQRFGLVNATNHNSYLNIISIELVTQQTLDGRPPRYAPPRPASDDTLYIIHTYGSVTNSMSMLACQYSQPKRPGDLDL